MQIVDQIRKTVLNGELKVGDRLPPERELAKEFGIDAVPVVAPTIVEERLKAILKQEPRFLYDALRKGITGEATEIGDDNINFLERINYHPGRLLRRHHKSYYDAATHPLFPWDRHFRRRI